MKGRDNSQIIIFNDRKRALTFTKKDFKKEKYNLRIFKPNTTHEIKINVLMTNQNVIKKRKKKLFFFIFNSYRRNSI